MSFYSAIIICLALVLTVFTIIFLKINYKYLRELLEVLAEIFLARIIFTAGIFYGFIIIFHNVSSVSSDFTIYIALIATLILLFQATSKIPSSANIKPVATTIRNYFTLIIIASALLYWHVSRSNIELLQFEAWIISLDTVLAHAVITIPMLQWFYYTVMKVLRVNELLLLELLSRLRNPKGIFKDFTLYSIFHNTIHPSFSISISLGLVWLLLVKTPDLQNVLFGKYNQLLGWETSTSYRFSVLFEQLKILFGNQALATIFGFAAFAISLTLSFSSVLSSIKTIGNEFKKMTDDS